MRKIRKAGFDELEKIMKIYKEARKFMKENGNKDQWGEHYPSQALLEKDIEQGNLYVCIEKEQIVGVFYFAQEEDETYRKLEEGEWLTTAPYAVVHRIASAKGTKGVATYCLNWAFEQYSNIRIDTHDHNKPMQNLLKKLGFIYCGRISLADGSPRIVFQKINDTFGKRCN